MKGIIYKITNNINDKVYVGKTTESIEQRFKIHIRDSKKESIKNRPLYSAFNKHGIENFSISVIEECNLEILDEREIYWIEFYHGYSYGYNATIGGDGKLLYDYEEIYNLIKEGFTTKEITALVGCCGDIVRKVANMSNIHITATNLWKESSISVNQYDLNNNFIQSFNSYADAARWLEENGYVKGNLNSVRGKISEVCRGKRKTIYKFIWKNN